MYDNFINYCDSMMIATEGVKDRVQKIQSWLIKQFNKLLDLLQKAVNHFKTKNLKTDHAPGAIAGALQQLIARCKAGLSKSKALNAQNPELAEKLKEEVNDITEEYKKLKKQLDYTVAIGGRGNPDKGRPYVGLSNFERKATERLSKKYGKRIDKVSKASEAFDAFMFGYY